MTLTFGERYQQLTLIGRGAFGEVYKVFDRDLGCYVALKSLSLLDPDGAFSLKHEFRILAAIRSPRLVVLHELVVSPERIFYTMELVDGLVVADYVDPNASEDVRLRRVLHVLPQLVEGIAAIHAAGVVHRDVKPSNLMVRIDGQLKIIDFGLAVYAARDASADAQLAGTLAYMAPELARDKVVTAASDWYSVGATLYHLLTGRLPFTLAELFSRRETAPASTHLQHIPKWLDDLLSRLLAVAPAARPSDQEILETVAANIATGLASDVSALGRATFVGRRRQLEALTAEHALAAAGGARVVAVTGPSGIGKTALVQRFLMPLRQSRAALVLAGACHVSESMPYRAVDGIIDALSTHLIGLGAKAPACTDEDVDALLSIFPVLGRIERWRRARAPARIIAAAEARRRAFTALGRLLEALGPAVLWVDDAQWGDRDSLQLLAALAAQPMARGLLIVLVIRTPAAGAPLPRELERHFGRRRLTQVEVPLLASEEIAALLPSALEASDRAHFELVTRESGGLPLFASELAVSQRSGGTPSSWTQLLDARIATLSSAAKAVLDLVCVAAHPLPIGDVVASYEGEAVHAATSIRTLLAERLLAPTATEPPLLQPYHHRIAEAVGASVSAPSRQAIHRTLALRLEARLDSDPSQIAFHLQAGGVAEPAEIGRLMLKSAERALELLAFDQAAACYEAAIAQDPSRVDASLLTLAADAMALAGRCERAAMCYRDAAALTSDPALTLRLTRLAAEQWLRAGSSTQGVPMLRDALAQQGVGFPKSAVAALLIVLWGRLAVSAKGTPFRAHAPDPAELERIDACWAATLGLNHLDILRSAAFQTRHLSRALRAGDRLRAVRGLSTEMVYRVAEGAALDSKRIRALDAQAEQLARESQDSRASGFYYLCVGAAQVFGGAWRLAHDTLTRADNLIAEHQGRGTWEAWNCTMYRAWARTHLGDFALEDELLPAINAAEARGDMSARAALSSGRCNLIWLASNEPDEASLRAREAITAFPATPFQTPHYFDLMARVNHHLFVGEGTQAWRAILAGWGPLKAIMFLRMRYFRIELRWLRARAAFAAAHESTAERKALLADAKQQARHLAREGTPHATTYARVLDSVLARASGDTRQSREHALSARLAAEATGQVFLRDVADVLASDASFTSEQALYRVIIPRATTS